MLRRPLGFGKNYFTLSAILAYSIAPRLQSQVTFAYSLLDTRFFGEKDAIGDVDDPPNLLESPLIVSTKPCACNLFFRLRARLSLLINLFIPRCPFYCKYFAFRRTGVHPPLTF